MPSVEVTSALVAASSQGIQSALRLLKVFEATGHDFTVENISITVSFNVRCDADPDQEHVMAARNLMGSRPPPLVTFEPYVLRCGEALIPNNPPNWDEYIATIRGLEGIRSVSETWAGSDSFSPVVARHILNRSTSPDNDKEMAILLTQEMVLGTLRQLPDDKQVDIYTTLNKIEDIIVTGNESESDTWMARDERLRDEERAQVSCTLWVLKVGPMGLAVHYDERQAMDDFLSNTEAFHTWNMEDCEKAALQQFALS
jgi:hypothetical protein